MPNSAFGRTTQALSASPLSHAERPLGLAFLLYPAFSCGVQRNSTRAVEGFLMGGLPRGRLGVMGVSVRTTITLDKGEDGLYYVRTFNEEARMPKKSRRKELADFVASGKLHTALRDKNISEDAIRLLIDIADRYCNPKPTRRRRVLP
jgi:hypothetical protein